MKILFLSFLLMTFSLFAYGQEEWNVWNKQGVELYNQGKYEEASSAFEKAKQSIENSSNKEIPIYATVCHNLGNTYFKLSKYQEAEVFYLETKNLREKILGKTHKDYAISCNSLGSVYEELGKFTEAESLYMEAKDLQAEILGKNNKDYAISCTNLAELYHKHLNKNEEAEKLYSEARIIIASTMGDTSPKYISLCLNLAKVYENLKKYNDAEILYIEVKDKREKTIGKEHQNYTISCNYLANLYYKQAKYREAEPIYLEVKEIREKVLGKDNLEYATSCSNLALVYQRIGKLSSAESLFLEALSIKEKKLSKEHQDYATEVNHLASLYKIQGRYKEAEGLYLEALKIRGGTLGPKNVKYATVCNNLGLINYRMGNYAKAESFYKEAIDIVVSTIGKDNLEYANNANSFGLLCLELGKYNEAKSLLTEVLKIRTKLQGKEHSDYATACNNLALLHYTQKKYPEAEKLYIEAKEIWGKTEGKKTINYATACDNLGKVYKKQKKYPEAEALYKEAINIREEVLGKDHPSYANSLNNLANCYKAQGKMTEAEPLFLQSIQTIEDVLGKEHHTYANICSNIAFFYEQQNKFQQAETYFLKSNQAFLSQIDRNFYNLSEKEKILFYKTFGFNLQIFNSFVLKRYLENPSVAAEVYNNTLATKALLFEASNKIRNRILNSKNDRLIKLYNDWKAKRENLSKIYELSAKERKEQGINTAQLEKEAIETEKILASESEYFAKEKDKKKYTWRDVQKSLKPGEAAIELVQFKLYQQSQWTDTIKYIALLIKPNGSSPEMIILENGNELEGKYKKFYQNAIKSKLEDNVSYNQYWAKIAERLKGINKVYLSLDGVYNTISLNTLKNPSSGQYLMDEMKLELVSNTKDIILKSPQNREYKEAVLIGFPDYNNRWSKKEKGDTLETWSEPSLVDTSQRFFDGFNISELFGTKKEVENVEQILTKAGIKTQRLIQEEAREEKLKKLSNPQVLHIATHGFFMQDLKNKQDDAQEIMGMEAKKVAENPLLRSGLLFANAKVAVKEGGDGVLTAYEAINLNLENTDLVVLSACETGLGQVKNGEGVYGLQRAFQQAGAKTVLMSLWTVSDDATQQLMTSFYDQLISKKSTKRQAFENAQMDLRKKYPDPYFWGAFVMVGE